MKTIISCLIGISALAFATASRAEGGASKHILFFSKSSGYEHSVISWKQGQPSYAEKILIDLGKQNGWEFTFSKDGSKFAPDYLKQFDAVFFYTSGNLCDEGNDKNPPMSKDGKQALFDYIRASHGFIGTHSSSDSFHTDNESQKGPERYKNHGDKADDYVKCLGGEFIIHGAQQIATNKVIDPKFPGFEKAGDSFAFHEEWYSLKDFNPDIHALTVIDSPSMKGTMYERPPYPSSWARKEGNGRVWYTAMGHREDIWTNPTFQQILVGGIKWVLGDAKAEVPANIKEAAPGAYTNPKYVEPPPKAPAKEKKK